MKRWVVWLVIAVGAGMALVACGTDREAHPPHTHEILYNRPSGFWTSNLPATNGAYRYRLLLIGCAIAIGMGWLMYRVVKKYGRRA